MPRRLETADRAESRAIGRSDFVKQRPHDASQAEAATAPTAIPAATIAIPSCTTIRTTSPRRAPECQGEGGNLGNLRARAGRT
jgi:hypothetical protein